jgi:UDP-GlcNAc:undecaprenyl-phosphate GlcNAc-1-phosphate transferase
LALSAFLAAAFLTALLVPLAMKLAWATGYLDQPEARKLHISATALLGGPTVFLCALVAWIVTMRLGPHAPMDPTAWDVLFGAAVAMGIGLWDDRHGMRPAIKMFGQAVAASTLLVGDAVPHLGLPAGIDAAVTLVALIALMNAVNFLDNMNGMVSGLAAIALAGFAWSSAARGANGIAAAQLALAGACAGFLPYNFPRARIFLGDAGSLMLGYCLGASALLAMKGAPPGWGQAGPVLVLAFPAFDMIFVVITRLRDGHPVAQGGKDHTNHRLATLLGDPVRTVPLGWLSGAALCASGMAVLQLDRALPTLALCAVWAVALLAAGLRLATVPVVRKAA